MKYAIKQKKKYAIKQKKMLKDFVHPLEIPDF